MIKAHGLRKLYANGDNTLAALDEVSFEVERGEFIVILGASGSGKTTLLNVISGLEKADRGYIDVDGVELQTLSEEERTRFRREHVGIIFQKFNLIPELSVFDNIILPSRLVNRDIKEEEVLEIVDELGIKEKLFLMPGILSGGEQQRVAIARALYTRPSVILADEPTGSVELVQHYPKQIPVIFPSLSTFISSMTDRQRVRFSSRVKVSYIALKSAVKIFLMAAKSGGASCAGSGSCPSAAVYIS